MNTKSNSKNARFAAITDDGFIHGTGRTAQDALDETIRLWATVGYMGSVAGLEVVYTSQETHFRRSTGDLWIDGAWYRTDIE